MKAALLVVHGGGPTAVLNASLYGVLREAARHPEAGRVLGARGGMGGIAREDFVDLAAVPAPEIALLPSSPGSAIGSSREMLDAAGYGRIAETLRKREVRWLLCAGGNGTMDACGRIAAACAAAGVDTRVMGVPKTIDNDLALTDHSPGYGSAARFIAASAAELACDLAGLPIHIVVLEAQGRNAGWLTAATALARDSFGAGPDILCLPERPFDEDRFLAQAEDLWRRKGHGLVAASEGLRDAAGNTVVPPVFQTGRAVYYGDTGSYLAGLITRRLGVKARAEKPGLLGRASIAWQSAVDRDEAILAGEMACRAAFAGESGKMLGFERLPGPAYAVKPFFIPVEEVMLHEKTLDDRFIDEGGAGVTEAFLDWCRPLTGPLPRLARF